MVTSKRPHRIALVLPLATLASSAVAHASSAPATAAATGGPVLLGIPVAFILFGLTLKQR